MNQTDIKQVIKDMASPLPERRESAIQSVLAHREEAIPELLKVLELMKNVPVGAAVTLSDWSWFLAAYLLAQFREERALPILLSQFSMPPEHVERIFRDILTEDLPRLLATLCEKDPKPLRDLIESKTVHDSVRASALWGYTLLTAVGILPRQEAIDYYAELFKGKLERRPSQVWTTLVASCAALHARGLKEEILKAYHQELADPSAFSMKEVLKEWDITPEESQKRLATDSGGLIKDVWEEMEYWPWEEEAGQEASEE